MSDVFLRNLTTFNYQEVCISISWAAQSRLTCSCHFCLSGRACFHFTRSTITVDMSPLSTLSECVSPFYDYHNQGLFVPALSIIRKCVSSFHSWHHHGWHIPTTFDYQEVRHGVPFHEQHHHGWQFPSTFDYQQVRIYIPWAAPSRLICSRHFWLSASAYFHFISSSHGWRVQVLAESRHFQLSGSAYFHFMSCIFTADMFPPLSILSCTISIDMFPPISLLSWCVFPFHNLNS